MIETEKLLAAFERVEDKVSNLQTAFEKKSTEDEIRFLGIETNVNANTKLLSQHSVLHTQHAQMISQAQDLTLTKTGQEWNERLAKIEAASVVRDKILSAQDVQLQRIVKQGQNTKSVVDIIAKYHKHPAFKLVYYVGVAVWGGITAWLAAHH